MTGLRTPDGLVAAPPLTKDHYEWDRHLDMQGTALDSSTRYTLTWNPTRLLDTTSAWAAPEDADFEISGTNAVQADVTFASTIGGIELDTHGAADDQTIVGPHATQATAWHDVAWGTENQVIWEAVVRTGASITNIVLWAGLKLTNTPTVATDADQAFFRFDAVVANWEATYSIAGTDTETDTGVAVAASTNYYLRIEIDSSRLAHFFINGKEVATSTALTNDISLWPFIGVMETTTTAGKQINVIKQKISRIIFE